MIAAGLILGVALVFSEPAPADEVPAVEIVPGAPQQFELPLGASRRHALALEAGQFLEVEMREDGPRTMLSFVGPDGATLGRRGVLTDRFRTYRLLAISVTGGTHTLEVQSSGEGQPGTYEIRIHQPRPAGERESARAAADDALDESIRLSNERSAESSRAALARVDAAEAGFRDAGDDPGRAQALSHRGRLQFDAGQAAAGDSMEQSLALFRSLGHRDGEGAALHDLAWLKLRKGDVEGARTLFSNAGESARATQNGWLLLAAVNGLAVTYTRTGQDERAIELYMESLTVAREVGSRRGQWVVLSNLGNAYNHLGEHQKSLDSYERSLSMSRTSERRDDTASTLMNMAGLVRDLGDRERALALVEEALSFSTSTGQPALEARALSQMAGLLSRRGDHDRAIELGRRSLELRRRIKDRVGESASLQLLGQCLRRFGDVAGALEHMGQALSIRQGLGQPIPYASTLYAMAEVERDRGNLREALAHAQGVVTVVEDLRAALTNPDLRAAFVAAEDDVYGLYIDILMRLHEQESAGGHDAAALQASERARARVLLDALIEARADIRQGVDAALLEQERTLQKDMSEASARLSAALARGAAAEAIETARRELAAKNVAYRDIQAHIRQESPRYAGLTQPEPATVDRIRREVLDDDTVLLEFYLGKERSFLWAATRADLVSRTLPGQADIEAAARKVHTLLTERQRTRTPAATREADVQLAAESRALSRVLLDGIAARLDTDWKGKRLLIVASGALAYLPFGALPSPGEGAAQPLVFDHEIVSVPSASVLAAMRREEGPRTASPTTVAVLADPVFEAADPRVHRGAGAAPKAAVAPLGLTRAMESLGRERFPRLPFSRGEAAAIAAFLPKSSLLKATDFAAARTLVTQGALGDRRIIHFATHGVLNTEHPDLSGLVLSLVDEKGAPTDGFLRMHEIYNLRLPADLVVLSACQTALGREMRGEGLVGLTRGFMYAGARRVVASLWQVDDESTSELMKRFYRAMLKDGRRPADALRAAQIEMARDRRWSAPFYWAGFVLQGEWR